MSRPGKPEEIAVCAVPLADIALGRALAALGGPELERAGRISSREYFAQHVKGRALLRWWLGEVTGQSPKGFEIVEDGSGAPRLADNPWGIHFNLSHSRDWVLVALSRLPVGVDIECSETEVDWHAIAGVCFHPSEQQYLACLEGDARREAFFDIWTRKEAYLKGIGTGLGTDPGSFSTLTNDHAVAAGAASTLSPNWYTRMIDAPPGYKAALACHSPHARITYCQFAAAQGEIEPVRTTRACWGLSPPQAAAPQRAA